MGCSKLTENGVERVYAAAEAWSQRGLLADDSLFTPGKAIWTADRLGELRARVLAEPAGGLFGKLEQQLAGSLPEVYQLMGEVLFVHYLIIYNKTAKAADTKANRINQVLGWQPRPPSVPVKLKDELKDALSPGIASIGPNNFIKYRVGFLIELAEQLKENRADRERVELLKNPWEFKHYTELLQFKSATMKQAGNRHHVQVNATLHLLFPCTFEYLVKDGLKAEVAKKFTHLVTEPTDDIDRKLQQIRSAVEKKRRAVEKNWRRYIGLEDTKLPDLLAGDSGGSAPGDGSRSGG